MADRDRTAVGHHQVQVHPQRGSYADSVLRAPQRSSGPTTIQVLVVVTLLPVGGTLLAVAGLTLVGTLIGLTLTTPLFLLASPILVPATLLLGLAVAGFMASGTFGLTGFSSLSWVLNGFREKLPDSMDYAKQCLQDTVETLGQKTREAGEKIQTKAHEARTGTGTGTGRDTTTTASGIEVSVK